MPFNISTSSKSQITFNRSSGTNSDHPNQQYNDIFTNMGTWEDFIAPPPPLNMVHSVETNTYSEHANNDRNHGSSSMGTWDDVAAPPLNMVYAASRDTYEEQVVRRVNVWNNSQAYYDSQHFGFSGNMSTRGDVAPIWSHANHNQYQRCNWNYVPAPQRNMVHPVDDYTYNQIHANSDHQAEPFDDIFTNMGTWEDFIAPPPPLNMVHAVETNTYSGHVNNDHNYNSSNMSVWDKDLASVELKQNHHNVELNEVDTFGDYLNCSWIQELREAMVKRMEKATLMTPYDVDKLMVALRADSVNQHQRYFSDMGSWNYVRGPQRNMVHPVDEYTCNQHPRANLWNNFQAYYHDGFSGNMCHWDDRDAGGHRMAAPPTAQPHNQFTPQLTSNQLLPYDDSQHPYYNDISSKMTSWDNNSESGTINDHLIRVNSWNDIQAYREAIEKMKKQKTALLTPSELDDLIVSSRGDPIRDLVNEKLGNNQKVRKQWTEFVKYDGKQSLATIYEVETISGNEDVVVVDNGIRAGYQKSLHDLLGGLVEHIDN